MKPLMKNSLHSAILASILASTQLIASNTITIQNGWNLLGSGNNDINLTATFASHPGVQTVWGFTNDTKQWLAYGNNAAVAQLIANNSTIGNLESIPPNLGFWVLNNGQAFTINVDTNNSYNDQNNSGDYNNTNQGNSVSYTYGTSTTDTFASFIGHTLFSIWENGYSTDELLNTTTINSTEYDKNGTLLTNQSISIALDANNSSFTYSMQNGEEGRLQLNGVRTITALNGTDTTSMGLKELSITSTTTAQASSFTWENAHWTPRVYDNNGTSTLITNIVTLKNQYLTNDWSTGNNNERYFFEASTDTSVTSGNLVGADSNGTYPNCTPSQDIDCTRYVRNNTVVGTWNLTNDVLTMDAPSQIKAYKFEAGVFQEGWIEKVGSTDTWTWLTPDTQYNSTLETFIKQN